jgi:alkylation response protein AidB-like acyl-CoA dehydrogenase
MDFDLSAEEEDFRKEVRAFIEENMNDDGSLSASRFSKDWNQNAFEKGYVGFSWPKEVGCREGTIMEQAILKQEMSKVRAPALGSCFMGLAWVGPGIIEYGSEEQKKRFIPDILEGKYQWCTGYSEPAVGSDLASLACKAELQGDHYLVSGQKIWTSLAPFASWIILLVRTDNNVEVKHEGITCLLVDLKAAGVEVRPIENMAGGKFFAEVFFSDVKVPVENRLGEEGQGWQVTISALANERSSIGEVTAMETKLDRLKSIVKQIKVGGKPALEDSATRRRLARYETIIEAMRYNGMRYLTAQLKGEPLSSETSVNKLHRSYLEVDMADFAVDLLGQAGIYLDGDDAVSKGLWAKGTLSWPDTVIGGGTENIQKNIISERILGLPKD